MRQELVAGTLERLVLSPFGAARSVIAMTLFPLLFSLGLTFTNTDDAVATQVTFDIAHDGTHTMVTDRGRFSRGARIEHNFDDLFGGYGSGGAQCAVVAVTFADGRRWTAPVMTANRADRTFHPDFSRALTVDQMNRAWQNELDRINPPVVTGGG